MKKVSFLAIEASNQSTFKEQEKAFKESIKAFCKGAGFTLVKCGGEKRKVYGNPLFSMMIEMRTVIEYPSNPAQLAAASEKLLVAYLDLLKAQGWSLEKAEP